MQARLVRLSSAERKELVERVRSRTGRAEDARRARLILMLSSGKSYSAIVQALECNRSYVSRWKERFLSERLGGLYARHRGRAGAKRTPRCGSADSGVDAPRSWRRGDPLEQPQTGC